MPKIAEAYIHVEYGAITDRRFNELREEIVSALKKRTEQYFVKGVELEILIEDQSFLVRAAVLGGLVSSILGGGYAAMVNYPEFREGVIAACDDAEKFGWTICDDVFKILNTKEKDKIYRRTKPREITSIRRLIKHIDKSIDANSPEETEELERMIEGELAYLSSVGVPDDQLRIVIDLLPKESLPGLERDVTQLKYLPFITSPVANQMSDSKMGEIARRRKPRHRFATKIIL